MAVPTPTKPDQPASQDDRTSPARRALPVLLRCLLALVAGVSLYLSVPPLTTWWLAPVGFALLGWLLLDGDRKARAGFGYGLLTGLGFLTPLLAWTGEFVGPIAWLPLSLAESVLIGLSTAVITVVSRLPGAPWWAALLWMAGEALRAAFPFGGFPWATIAFGQPEGIYLPLAAVGGAPLVSFAVVLTGFGATALLRRVIVEKVVADRPRALHRLLAPGVAVVLPVAGAFAAVSQVHTEPDAGEVTVAAIQGNVPRAGLDFNAQRRAVLDNHVERTLQLADDVRSGRAAPPDLVIWPENASDIDPLRNLDARAAINEAATAIGAPIAVGSVVERDDGRPLNAIILWDPELGPTDQYVKRQLQPFGETMPGRSFFRLFTPAVDRANNFVPGDEPTVFAMGDARVALATCYEVAFDSVVRDSVLNGSNLLAVPTNNATFGHTNMTYQQLAMDRVRAVEHGRTVVVAATSGVSAIVLPDGSVTQRSELFTPDALVERVPLRAATTLSDRLGGWPQGIMVFAGLAGLAMAITTRIIATRRHRRDRAGEEETDGGRARAGARGDSDVQRAGEPATGAGPAAHGAAEGARPGGG